MARHVHSWSVARVLLLAVAAPAALLVQGCGDDKCKDPCCACSASADCGSGLSCDGVYNSRGIWSVCMQSGTHCSCSVADLTYDS